MRRVAIVTTAALMLAAVATGARALADGDHGERRMPASIERVKAGVWGGEHARLEATAEGGSIEYDCGRGMIDEPLVLDAQGRFTARGRHSPERGGPARRDEPPPAAARYVGRVNGNAMTLTVTVEGAKDALGPFTLIHGADVALTKCR